MVRSAISPKKYAQEQDSIADISRFAGNVGKLALLLVDKDVKDSVEKPVQKLCSSNGSDL